MADHFAEDDEDAISIARSIVANFNLPSATNTSQRIAAMNAAAAAARGGGGNERERSKSQEGPKAEQPWDEPLFDPREMGSIIPTDSKKPFDVRKVKKKGTSVGHDTLAGLKNNRRCPRVRLGRAKAVTTFLLNLAAKTCISITEKGLIPVRGHSEKGDVLQVFTPRV